MAIRRNVGWARCGLSRSPPSNLQEIDRRCRLTGENGGGQLSAEHGARVDVEPMRTHFRLAIAPRCVAMDDELAEIESAERNGSRIHSRASMSGSGAGTPGRKTA